MWKYIFIFIEKIAATFNYKKRVERKIDLMMRRVIRLEILDAIKRKDTTTVYTLFDEYRLMGGNSYISDMVETYLKKEKRSKK